MEWDDIYDPRGEIDFALNWQEIRSQYIAEEIQHMIDENGVIDMLRVVNEHFWLSQNRKPLRLGYDEIGRKAVFVQ